MSDKSKFFLTLDVGTTSVKAGVFDLTGRLTALSTIEYKLETPSQNLVELDPMVYWNCCKNGIKEILTQTPSKDNIVSIAVCSQGETLITLDKRGRPLRNAIVWMDNRSQEEADRMKSDLGLLHNTGQPDVNPTWTATKILWMRNNEPELFDKTWKFLLVEDFIVYKLSGETAGSYSLYPSSYLLDIIHKRWNADMLEYLEIGAEKLSVLGESSRIVGTLRSEVAAELGLPANIKIISGTMDLTAGLIGSGCINAGIVTEITGAAEVFCQTIDDYPKCPPPSMAVQCHAIPGKYLILGWCSSGGMSLKWLRDTFFKKEIETANQQKIDAYDVMTEMAADIPMGCEGLTFFPYLAGAGTSAIDSDVRGIFWGIELHHTIGHFVRAVMESLAYVLKTGLDEMAESGTRYSDIRVLGGGAKSLLWNQIKADVLDNTVTTMKCPESASLGTAILQAVGMGFYSSVQEAVQAMVQPESIVKPNPDNLNSAVIGYKRFSDLERKHLKRTARN